MGMRKNLLLLCLLTMAAYASAERVDADRALQVATAAVHGQKQLRGDQADALKLVYTATDNGALRSAGETVYYYVFNVGTDDGFIIVAGDDIATPILGYSRSGGYDAANLPPAFAGWMKGTAGQIADAVRQGITQSSDTRRQWDAYTGGTAQAIYYAPGADYLVTTIWD